MATTQNAKNIEAAPAESPATETQALELQLGTAAATRRLGKLLGQLLQAGDLLGLEGPLGAGKTSLVSGLAAGLKWRGAVTSPTFTLINQYAGRLLLYHVDLYRLGSEMELIELGLWEAAEAGGVLAVEWLSRFPESLPADRLELHIAPAADGKRGRTLRLNAQGPRSAKRLAELRCRLEKERAFS